MTTKLKTSTGTTSKKQIAKVIKALPLIPVIPASLPKRVKPSLIPTAKTFTPTDITDIGEYMELPVNVIQVDKSTAGGYQRDGKMIKRIVKNWNPKLFHPIAVNMRVDGSFYTYDGGNRLEAFKLMGFPVIPAMVRLGMDQVQESDAFLLMNSHYTHTNAGAMDRWPAGVLSGDLLYVNPDTICKKYGVVVSKVAGPRKCSAAMRIIELCEQHKAAFNTAMALASELCVNHAITEQLICGLFEIQYRFHKIKPGGFDLSGANPEGKILREKILELGPAVLHRSAKQWTTLKGKVRGGWATWAEGIMREVNSQYRKKKNADDRFPFPIA